MRRVWITRTLPAAEGTAIRVRNMGFEPVVSPLRQVVQPKIMPPMPDDDCLLAFTSKNGVRAFSKYTDKRHWPVVTVGDATADLASDFGFDNVISASGTASDIVDLIKSAVEKTIPIIHCAGETIRVDIAVELNLAGFSARRNIYYRTEPTRILPDNVDKITYVLLHSPLAAKSLRELNLDVSHMTAVSMSEAANTELGTFALREKRIANAPTETALLACLHS